MSLSTHVIDAVLGRPAAGVHVVLSRRSPDGWTRCAQGRTDADGRLRPLDDASGEAQLEAGVYELTFDTAAYFAAPGRPGSTRRSGDVRDHRPSAHHHVPLLLSPFAFSTYRGS